MKSEKIKPNTCSQICNMCSAIGGALIGLALVGDWFGTMVREFLGITGLAVFIIGLAVITFTKKI